jgi:hypothetical protein
MRGLVSRQNALALAAAAFLTLSLPHDSVPLFAPKAVVTVPAVAAVAEAPLTLIAPSVVVSYQVSTGRLVLATTDGKSRREMDLSLVIDDNELPAVGERAAHLHSSETTIQVPLTVTGLPKDSVVLTLALDEETSALSASIKVSPGASTPEALKRIALRFGMAPIAGSVFIPGRGELADTGDVAVRAIVLDDGPHPVAFTATLGELTSALVPPEFAQSPATQPRLVLTTPFVSGGGGARIVVPESTQELWTAVYSAMQIQIARVNGIVTGTAERARVTALDEQGHPLLRFLTREDGRFAVDAPPDAIRWYANLEASHASAPVRHAFGRTDEVHLHVAPGGELHVRVVDPDADDKPLVSRLVVKGVEGTVDPQFQADFRGRGVGPIMDLRTGETRIPVPEGKYRVAATKGIEWSIDSEVVQVGNGRTTSIDLRPRHVVPSPGIVGCDLHVHARPSFDSSVTPEDRVVSLASAGVDFAVPTEHNKIGDYGPAIETEHLNGQLAWVPGVEVTTYNARLGHFGVFPYPKDVAVPPYRHTTVGAVFAASRKGDASRALVVHHPRLPLAIGYFDVLGLDTKSGRLPAAMRTDFDVLEVYNGYEVMERAKVERVIDDWFGLLEMDKRYSASGSSDSHKLQYQWAGYPRTYVELPADKAGDDGRPIDTAAVVAAVKQGHGFVTSGPIIDLDIDGTRPGDTHPYRGPVVTAHVRVRAAPWIDVSNIQIVASRTTVFQTDLVPYEVQMGVEKGTIEEASARAVRYEKSIDLNIPPGAKWLVVIVRGNQSYADALPFMPVQPLAFTNPVWLGQKP